MKRLVTSREIHTIYDRWFAAPIPPKNTPLNIPMTYLLNDLLEVPDRLGSRLSPSRSHVRGEGFRRRRRAMR